MCWFNRKKRKIVKNHNDYRWVPFSKILTANEDGTLLLVDPADHGFGGMFPVETFWVPRAVMYKRPRIFDSHVGVLEEFKIERKEL